MGAELLPAGFVYEPYTVDYVLEKRYVPDFVLADCHVEVKGYFRAGDTTKYKVVAQTLQQEGLEFVFLFQTPNKKIRKGAKMTMAQWADRNQIPWFSSAQEIIDHVLDS